MVGGSVGADGGGSIRLPAAYCGVTGIKPTFNVVPMEGNLHAYLLLDALGPFGRDAGDTRLMLEALASREFPPGDASKLRVGIPAFMWDDVDPEVERACRATLDAAGWQTEDVAMDGEEFSRIATVLRLALEGMPEFGTDHLATADAVTVALAKYAFLLPAVALVRADRVRSQIRRSLADLFGRVGVLALPTVPAAAPVIENTMIELPSGPTPADKGNVRQTGWGNLAGVPGISVPAGLTSAGLPIGLQLVAPWGEEARLLDAAEHIEHATSRQFVDAVPPAYA
jgi:Asp-tRNA(Asn)/Glu-tRNA(Gln) amidotransferase A subunit family amidase